MPEQRRRPHARRRLASSSTVSPCSTGCGSASKAAAGPACSGPSGVGKTTLLRLIAGLAAGRPGGRRRWRRPAMAGSPGWRSRTCCCPGCRPSTMCSSAPACAVPDDAELRRLREPAPRTARPGRPRRSRRQPARHPFRRHAAARGAGPHADGGPPDRPDGRAVLRPRRDHPPSPAGSRRRAAGRAAPCSWSPTTRSRRCGSGIEVYVLSGRPATPARPLLPRGRAAARRRPTRRCWRSRPSSWRELTRSAALLEAS